MIYLQWEQITNISPLITTFEPGVLCDNFEQHFWQKLASMCSLALYQEDMLCPPRNFLAAEMLPFEIIEEGVCGGKNCGSGGENEWLSGPSPYVRDSNGCKWRASNFPAKAGYIGGNSLFAGKFHCKPDAFWKSMIFQQFSLSMYVQVELCCAAVIAIY